MTDNHLPHKAECAIALYMLIICDFYGRHSWSGLQKSYFHMIEDARRLPRKKLYGFLKACGWQWHRTRWNRISSGDIHAGFEVLYGQQRHDPIYWD